MGGNPDLNRELMVELWGLQELARQLQDGLDAWNAKFLEAYGTIDDKMDEPEEPGGSLQL